MSTEVCIYFYCLSLKHFKYITLLLSVLFNETLPVVTTFWVILVYLKVNINGNFELDQQYYLEKNLEAREKALEREAELEDKSPKAKAKSKMSKVTYNHTY